MPVEAVEAVVPPAPAPEKPPEGTPEPPKAPEPPKSDRFARLAKAEQQRVAKEQALKVQESTLAKRQADLDAWETRRKGYAQNPLQALMDAFPGMEPVKAFELIAEAAKNGGKPGASADTYAVRQELAEFKAQQAKATEEAQKLQAAASEQAAKEAEAAFRDQITEVVDANPDDFELTKLYGQTSLVYATIEEAHQRTGKIMPIKEAAALVEKYLEGEAEKALKTKRIQAKLAPQPGTRTLSNDLAQGGSQRGPMTEQERMARALAALGG